jgi:hypothetical protein
MTLTKFVMQPTTHVPHSFWSETFEVKLFMGGSWNSDRQPSCVTKSGGGKHSGRVGAVSRTTVAPIFPSHLNVS